MAFTRELQKYIDSMGYTGKYPQVGSNGVYLNPLVVNLIELNGNQIKLFFLLVAAADEYNQVHKSRKEIGSMYMKTYNSSNMSADMKRLSSLGMIATVGNVPMINPFIVLPSVKNPKIKYAIQEAWRGLVEFGDSV